MRELGFVDFVRVPEACPRTSVVLVYRAWDRERCEVADVARARALPGGSELEVVMHPRRSTGERA